jgi:hypothetical protein
MADQQSEAAPQEELFLPTQGQPPQEQPLQEGGQQPEQQPQQPPPQPPQQPQQQLLQQQQKQKKQQERLARKEIVAALGTLNAQQLAMVVMEIWPDQVPAIGGAFKIDFGALDSGTCDLIRSSIDAIKAEEKETKVALPESQNDGTAPEQGQRIEMLWPDSDTWFTALVQTREINDAGSVRALLKYDEGTEEWVDTWNDVTWRLEQVADAEMAEIEDDALAPAADSAGMEAEQ